MHRDEYHQACHPDPAEVLGVRLQPFTLGHAHLLARMGSPFVCEGIPAIGDVVLGVEVCRRSYQNASIWLGLGSTPRYIEKQAKKWLKQTADQDIGPISEFIHYVSHAANGPRFWVEQKNAAQSGADWLQSLKLGLLKTGRTAVEAMNTPLGEAMWDYAAHWETEGALKLHTETDDALLEAVKKAKEAPCPEGLVPI